MHTKYERETTYKRLYYVTCEYSIDQLVFLVNLLRQGRIGHSYTNPHVRSRTGINADSVSVRACTRKCFTNVHTNVVISYSKLYKMFSVFFVYIRCPLSH